MQFSVLISIMVYFVLTICGERAENETKPADDSSKQATPVSRIFLPSSPTCGLVKPNDNSACSKHKNNACACSNAMCEFSTADGSCASLKPCKETLKQCLSSTTKDQCFRQGTFYVNGGILCKNKYTSGDCDVIETIIGTKMTMGAAYSMMDSRGVIYTHEKFQDPSNIRQIQDLKLQNESCKWDTWTGEPGRDVLVYKTSIHGKPGASGCLHYPLPIINRTGQYELSLKFVETTLKTNTSRRTFSISLGGSTIIRELNIFDHVGHCQPFEVIVPIQITNDGNSAALQGFSAVPNTAEHMGKLSICFGSCAQNKHPNFIVSAFYITRLGINRDRCDEQTDEGNNCATHGNNVCECRRGNCESSLRWGTCHPKETCQQRIKRCPYSRLRKKCLRAGAYYADGGVLCRNELQSGNCNIFETVRGVKMTLQPGKTITDSRNVSYTHERYYQDPGNIRDVPDLSKQATACPWNTWTGEARKDIEIYKTIIRGKPDASGCLSYLLPDIRKVGLYELSLKFVEQAVKNSTNRRTFLIKLGPLTVIRQLDVFHYAGNCNPMEVIIPIEVINDGNSVLVQGFPSLPNNAEYFGKLSLCFGLCGNRHPNFIISSFYLAKMDPSSSHVTQVGAYESIREAVVNKPCEKYTTMHPEKCKEVLSKRRCLRAGAFYLIDGELCKNDIRQENCLLTEPSWGYKAMDPREHFVDSRNVSYAGIGRDGLTSIEVDDPNGTQDMDDLASQLTKCRRHWSGIPIKDTQLYKAQINGKPGKNGCLDFHLSNFRENGNYELSLKFVEHNLTNDSTRRTFNIKFEDVIIVRELDVFRYVGYCQPMEINVRIYKQKTLLDKEIIVYVEGVRVTSKPIHPLHSVVTISLCPGTCFNVSYYNYILSSFYFTKLVFPWSKVPCDEMRNLNRPFSSSNDTCRCKTNGSEMNLNGVCLPRKLCWGGFGCENHKGIYTGICLRGQARDNVIDRFYVSGGVLCSSIYDSGDCDILNIVTVVNTTAEDIEKINGEECLSYDIPEMKMIGRYEIALTFGKADHNTGRYFVAKLGELRLINEMNIDRYAQDELHGIKVYIPFNITDNGRKINVLGFPEMPNDNSHAGKLAFCNRKCYKGDEYSNYSITGFHITRIGVGFPACETPNKEQDSDKNDCKQYKNDMCECANEGCQYNLAHGDCEPEECDKQIAKCERTYGIMIRNLRGDTAAVYFSDGGVLCRVVPSKLIDSVTTEGVHAIKMLLPHGQRMVDNRRVVYVEEEGVDDTNKTRRESNTTKRLSSCNISWNDYEFYKTEVHGDNETEGCLSYILPEIKDAGNYEISLKFLEADLNENSIRRMFDIKLGNMFVMRNLDVFKHVGKCSPMEIIIPFKIPYGGETVEVMGFPPMPNDREHMGKLSFCNSVCHSGNIRYNYIISSFYVAMYWEKAEVEQQRRISGVPWKYLAAINMKRGQNEKY